MYLIYNMAQTKHLKYRWLNKDSRTFLKRGYLEEGVTPEQRVANIAAHAESILKREQLEGVNDPMIEGFADKFEQYVANGWISMSSPIWSNFGTEKGLPISCFGAYTPDTMHGILGKAAEAGMMSKIGGGTSAYFGDVRHRGAPIKGGNGGTSNGAVHFLQLSETTTNVVSQGNTRRGSFAAYMPIDHPDILELFKIKEPGNPIQNLNFAVCISDDWMKDMLYGLDGKGGDIKKRELWTKVIEKRCASGEPYIFFTDTVNNAAPQVYKDKGKRIYGSNLCSEICLSSDETESFVCDLSSLNLLYYDEWKDTDVAEVVAYFLDAVMSDFIDKVKDIPFMHQAYKFAVEQRALGIGVLGWHSYLQSKRIPFESFDAKMINVQVFKNLKRKTTAATEKMAKTFGEPPLLVGYGRRNVTMMAIAPTTSSSQILGQPSPGIEPLNSNIFTKGLAKGDFTFVNEFLKEDLAKYEKDTEEIWENIAAHGGSVQHLMFLSDNERAVYKTFGELSQKEIVIQAAARQPEIDQSQSLNIMAPPSVDPKEISDLLIFGWIMKVKTFYYQRSANPSQELSRSIMKCISCDG